MSTIGEQQTPSVDPEVNPFEPNPDVPDFGIVPDFFQYKKDVFNQLVNAITADITSNANGEITAQVLRNLLNSILSNLSLLELNYNPNLMGLFAAFDPNVSYNGRRWVLNSNGFLYIKLTAAPALRPTPEGDSNWSVLTVESLAKVMMDELSTLSSGISSIITVNNSQNTSINNINNSLSAINTSINNLNNALNGIVNGFSSAFSTPPASNKYPSENAIAQYVSGQIDYKYESRIDRINFDYNYIAGDIDNPQGGNIALAPGAILNEGKIVEVCHLADTANPYPSSFIIPSNIDITPDDRPRISTLKVIIGRIVLMNVLKL
jgi:hypothetical protein